MGDALVDDNYRASTKFDGDEIAPGLWMGGYPLEGEIPPEWAMVAVGWLRSSRWHTGPRVEFQMDDEEGAVPARIELDRLAAFIHLHRISGRTVFVHCTAGINRSGLVLGYFMCCDGGLSGEEAVALIRSKRKSHGTPMKPLSNNSFADALRRWFPGEVERG